MSFLANDCVSSLAVAINHRFAFLLPSGNRTCYIRSQGNGVMSGEARVLRANLGFLSSPCPSEAGPLETSGHLACGCRRNGKISGKPMLSIFSSHTLGEINVFLLDEASHEK